MPFATWDPTLITGNPVVDKQHQRLFALIARVQRAVEEGEARQAVGEALAELARYTLEHFQAEEELMLNSAYPGREPHRRTHFTLLRQANALVAEHRACRGIEPQEVAAFLAAWLDHHIRGDDRALVAWLASRPAGGDGSVVPAGDCR